VADYTKKSYAAPAADIGTSPSSPLRFLRNLRRGTPVRAVSITSAHSKPKSESAPALNMDPPRNIGASTALTKLRNGIISSTKLMAQSHSAAHAI
jgi:hypothetical protein